MPIFFMPIARSFQAKWFCLSCTATAAKAGGRSAHITSANARASSSTLLSFTRTLYQLLVGKTQHQPHVLHGRARRALAQIVEPRDQHRLAMFLAGKDIELELVGLVERLGLDPPA